MASDDGPTRWELEMTKRVLDAVQDSTDVPTHHSLMDAKALVEQYQHEQAFEAEADPESPVVLSFAEVCRCTPAEAPHDAGFDVVELTWVEGGLAIGFDDPDED